MKLRILTVLERSSDAALVSRALSQSPPELNVQLDVVGPPSWLALVASLERVDKWAVTESSDSETVSLKVLRSSTETERLALLQPALVADALRQTSTLVERANRLRQGAYGTLLVKDHSQNAMWAIVRVSSRVPIFPFVLHGGDAQALGAQLSKKTGREPHFVEAVLKQLQDGGTVLSLTPEAGDRLTLKDAVGSLTSSEEFVRLTRTLRTAVDADLHMGSVNAPEIVAMLAYLSRFVLTLTPEEVAEGLNPLWESTSCFERMDFTHQVPSYMGGIVEALQEEDLGKLAGELRLTVLVSGHDLKFVRYVYPSLPEKIRITEDVWALERARGAAPPSPSLEEADIVWVEWLAGAAVWYSKRVKKHQPLIIRQHRYEILRDYGEDVRYENVAALIAIAVHTYEGVIERFPVERSKVRILPNIYIPDRYRQAAKTDRDRFFNLALVGSVPRLKGLHRAIELLRELRGEDQRYRLSVFGKTPEDLPWVLSNEDEAAYYRYCNGLIADYGLSEYIDWKGWADLSEELADYGFVLSVSDLEGSHVSPGEAYLAGNAGVYLKWRGAEYIYPAYFGFETLEEMAAFILNAEADAEEMAEEITAEAKRLAAEQGPEAFLRGIEKIVGEYRGIG